MLGQDTPAVTDTLWDHFKPMIPWILLSSVLSWYAGWKMGGIYCAGTKLIKRAESGFGSAVSGLGSSFSSGISSARNKIGLKHKRKKRRK